MSRPAPPALMILGTGSNVGKSLIVAGLCRLFADRGLKVRPFKPQNMSNNAAATAQGEIGRAQALQARAARTTPHPDMNPVLLKPEGEQGSQVILQGRVAGRLGSRDFGRRGDWLPAVLESFERLGRDADLVLVEGAGSPAETNLRARDIANLGFACAAGVPAVLIGDIDRGGVIASLVGTHAVLDAKDRAMIRGFAVNRFRGAVELFQPGVETISAATGWPCLGIVPWFPGASRLPAEDGLDMRCERKPGARLKIAVPVLPGIANFDDLDPLKLEPDVDLVLAESGKALPGDADLVILPGSKTTLRSLAALRHEGWDIDILAHRRRGGHVLGLCGGYQMLGRAVRDPLGLEGPPGEAEGLGLLDVETVLDRDKTVREVEVGHPASASRGRAYEIHLGRTEGPDTERAPFTVGGRPEGAASRDGRVAGSYLHGVLASDAIRAAWLRRLNGREGSGARYEESVEETLDALAAHLAEHLDIDALLALAQIRSSP
ncbi:cobyric acid synthase [Bosea sp. (in: a-proteobacteria)]|uniref:cobyric acid synthase n=1 Tax=Bosea sp. (in: a-proteobacteria) TaxID=1871050 RepID=UPI0011F97D72|nr:cobyric acid synthase [Bosea sp. (in: a-proteobacteria)]TAJ31227.1 MAG: cobyric acid synthase [Bosea sp. (in: a-proteobacteria)]